MGTHRHGLGVAILEGPLYAIGGHDGWSYLNTVERLAKYFFTFPFELPSSHKSLITNHLQLCFAFFFLPTALKCANGQ